MAQKFISGHNAISYEYLGLAYLNMGMLRVRTSGICIGFKIRDNNN